MKRDDPFVSKATAAAVLRDTAKRLQTDKGAGLVSVFVRVCYRRPTKLKRLEVRSVGRLAG